MEEKFISKALEANLAETRYKDIKIPPDFQDFINLSKKYFGIHKRANDCIIEFQHPFSNKKFVAEELREILLTDYWFYIGLDDPNKAFEIPILLMKRLLMDDENQDLEVLIIRTSLEFIQKLEAEDRDMSPSINKCCDTMEEGFKAFPKSFYVASHYFERHLKKLSEHQTFGPRAFDLLKAIKGDALNFWKESSCIENWLDEKAEVLQAKPDTIVAAVGKPWFNSQLEALNQISSWEALAEQIPDFNKIGERFSENVDLFPTFIEKFYYIFYLLKLEGMETHRERLIWKLNKMLEDAFDEIEVSKRKDFINLIFDFADGLRSDHMSSVLDMMLTLGKKVIDSANGQASKTIAYFEEKLIEFGFEIPGIVFVNEDWQLSVNTNHIKNIRVWLELIEYSQSEMEKLLSTLIVNLKLGGIFISDTDLFQREITKILNSNIAPYYKKVKQLTRIFPVYFNEIGAEGDIRKVTTTMDEIAHRKDKLIHFLRKQVHTESNNTLIGLTLRIFRFWNDGQLEALKNDLPQNVYQSIDKKSEWYAPVHQMVTEMCRLNNSGPDELIKLDEKEFEALLQQLDQSNEMDCERLRDMRRLFSFLKEKYSFESVDIINLLKRYSYIEEDEINQLKKALEQDDFENSLKLIYSFMRRLKEIIFSPKPSQSWENIYHKRHIAIGIPSMYGVYREPKFEALGLTFRLENVATRLMEKVVDQINLNYISGQTLKNIYEILDYFREGLELDGISNQSFNSNLLMLKYSLQSQSFSFNQYINIFQFIADDVKRTIIKYFLKTYEIPLRIVIPQLKDKEAKLNENEVVQLVNKISEEFYRDIIADAFLMQPLDNFILKILESLRKMADNLPTNMIKQVMSYNADLAVARLGSPNPNLDNQVFLGSKAYHLKNLRMAGFPIPPGFVITTEVFRRHKAIFGHPELRNEVYTLIRNHLKRVEQASGMEFGNPENPLLLSVRSGTAISMPGAMDTLLNVGVNDDIIECLATKTHFSWTAWDSYRRLLQSWGMAYGLSRDVFDEVIERYKIKFKVDHKVAFSPQAMKETALAYKETLAKNDIHFEEDVYKQLHMAINLVFESWSSNRAKVYREQLEIADKWGTAVIVQEMKFGNLGPTSGTGVVFTQNPQKEERGVHLYGDFTMCSQGEDIVSGLVKPLPVSRDQKDGTQKLTDSLQDQYPKIYKRIRELATELTENLGYSPQEIEFTFESENPDDLYILQTRDQDMANFESMQVFNSSPELMTLVGRGIGVGGGAMNARMAIDDEDIKKLRKAYPDEHVILVRPDTVPDDIGMIFATDGLLTAKGGATSHAAVTATRLGKTSVVNCTTLEVDESQKICTLGNETFKVGDEIAIDGHRGNVYKGHYPIVGEQHYAAFKF